MRVENAYAAGLIDGEGSISLCRHKSNEQRSPLVSVPSCTRELVNWLKSVFGGNISTKRTYKKNHSKSYTWSAHYDSCLSFLILVLPFMKEPEKIRRAEMLVKEYKKITAPNGKYTKNGLELKREFEKRFFKNTRRRLKLA